MILFDTLNIMSIDPEQIYTTNEAQEILKVSSSTMKRLLKKGLIRANKVGRQYRVFGKELLRVLSPDVERKAVNTYQKIKKNLKTKVRSW